jgi:hypothetical protein
MIKFCHLDITWIKKHKDKLLVKFNDCDMFSTNETNLKPEN